MRGLPRHRGADVVAIAAGFQHSLAVLAGTVLYEYAPSAAASCERCSRPFFLSARDDGIPSAFRVPSP